jgi:periplasmic divalent cation tolerance protein
MADILVVYVTYPSAESAQAISRAVLEGRLAACANIFPAHRSLYWWEGSVQDAAEVAVIYKTSVSGFTALKEKILSLHPYECPCVAAWPVERGHSAFLEWVLREGEAS